ncbi:heterokaryon incompatibility protein-domain-containing protein [Xylaria sp. FL0043]|nr:heterokaryon incompatibility protein-domain-containing protein [Xylaria sp. FL0043]
MESQDSQNLKPGTAELYVICPRDIEQLRIGPPGSNLYYLRPFRSFQYPRIPGRDYIRLLHLHSCDHYNPSLYGDLRVHKLDGQCEYEAISYSWGDYPKFTQGINLNGQILKITENLYAALISYRYPDRPRVLWVDAICIDQEDTAERAQQVAIMADIYSKAKAVQVWLAPGSPWMTDAIRFMADLSSRAESFGIDDEIKRSPWEQLPFLKASDNEAESLVRDAILAHVDFLFLRSWFNRVWVVQEATLATELVVSCGLSRIDWDAFAIAAMILRGAFRRLQYETDAQRMGGIKPAWSLIWYRHKFRLLDEDCSDDRDRIYAMLAMTTSPYAITPDYNKTVTEVFTEFAGKYSPNTQIYAAGLCRRQRQLRSENETIMDKNGRPPPIDISDRNYLPSWVPEFRPSLNLAWASPFSGKYSTATAASYFFQYHEEMPNVMHVTGTIFGIVYVTTRAYPKKRHLPPRIKPDIFFSLINQLQNIMMPYVDTDAKLEPSSEPMWLILAKTITSGTGEIANADWLLSQYPHFQSLTTLGVGSLPWLTAIWKQFDAHCLSPTGEVFRQLLLETLGGKTKPLSTDGVIAYGFLNYVVNIFQTDRVFLTRCRYLGLAPKDVRSGDFIAVFNGLPVPYVVRATGEVKYKADTDGKPEDLTFDPDLLKTGALQVIGPCYLHGIMKGEIFTNRDAPQFLHLKWTRYDGDQVDSLEGGLVLI